MKLRELSMTEARSSSMAGQICGRNLWD